jgi:hypothetical protein
LGHILDFKTGRPTEDYPAELNKNKKINPGVGYFSQS